MEMKLTDIKKKLDELCIPNEYVSNTLFGELLFEAILCPSRKAKKIIELSDAGTWDVFFYENDKKIKSHFVHSAHEGLCEVLRFYYEEINA